MEIKENTKAIRISDNKNIIQSVDFEDFKFLCDGLEIVEQSLKNIWEIAMDPETDDKLRADIYKWLIEMNVGKARQSADITSKGEKITAGIFIDSELL